MIERIELGERRLGVFLFHAYKVTERFDRLLEIGVFDLTRLYIQSSQISVSCAKVNRIDKLLAVLALTDCLS